MLAIQPGRWISAAYTTHSHARIEYPLRENIPDFHMDTAVTNN